MFDKKYEERLAAWRDFREQLETAEDPIQETIYFFSKAPLVNFAADPWDKSTWPNPWELISENTYCRFVKILAILYTLQLTDRFSHSDFKIHITQDRERSETNYLLFVEDRVVGLTEDDVHVSQEELPNNFYSECVYNMPPLQ